MVPRAKFEGKGAIFLLKGFVSIEIKLSVTSEKFQPNSAFLYNLIAFFLTCTRSLPTFNSRKL